MANEIIRPTQLPSRANPVATEVTVSDDGSTVAGVTWENGVNAAVPPASQPESEAGLINSKRMTPLTTKQAIDAQVPPKISAAIGALNLGSAAQAQVSDFATAAQGALADTAVQPADLADVATSGDYEDLSNKPTARLIPAGGLTSQSLVKSSDSDYATEWVTSAAATAVSYAPQFLDSGQKGQARANISAGTFSWNWIINGDFSINQRGGVKKPANGVYGYDRWKGHANGIEQVVEALPAGEYTLTWAGGGNGSFGGVTGPSPIKATVTAGDRSVVVPATSTNVSLVKGDATAENDPFVPRPAHQELALCQRYYEKSYDLDVAPGTMTPNGAMRWQLSSTSTNMYPSATRFAVVKRSVPAMTIWNPTTGASNSFNADTNNTAIGVSSLLGTGTASTGAIAAAAAGVVGYQYTAHFTADAEI